MADKDPKDRGTEQFKKIDEAQRGAQERHDQDRQKSNESDEKDLEVQRSGKAKDRDGINDASAQGRTEARVKSATEAVGGETVTWKNPQTGRTIEMPEAQATAEAQIHRQSGLEKETVLQQASSGGDEPKSGGTEGGGGV